MFDLKQTERFRKWRTRLRDERARATIASRLDRLAYGHAGDARPLGKGISEVRIDYGPGYRIYFDRKGDVVIRASMRRRQVRPNEGTIKTAQRLARETE